MAMERIEALSRSRRELAEAYQKTTDHKDNKVLSDYYIEIESAIQNAFDMEIKYLSSFLEC